MAAFYQMAGGFCPLAAGITEIDYRLLGWNVSRWYFKASVSVAMEERAVPLLDADVRVSTLGSFRVYVNDTPLELKHEASRKVMLVLLLSEKHRASRETLAGIIWPDSIRSKSLANLRQSLLNLKKTLQPLCGNNTFLQADQQSIELVNCSVTLDTQELLSKVKQKQFIDADSQIAKQVIEGYASELKSGSDLFIEWLAASENAYLNELKNSFKEAIESVDSTDLKLQYANFLSALDSCNELACRAKMQIYHGNGEKAKALSCYSELWVKLEELFDVEPSNATQELAVAIKLGENEFKNLDIGALYTTQTDQSKSGDTLSEISKNLANDELKSTDHNSIVPRIAIVPFVGRGIVKEQQFVGEVLADDLINVLSKCNAVTVISRLSSSVFSGIAGAQQTIKMLKLHYLMTGSYRIISSKIILDVEFCCARTSSILWEKRFTGSFEDFVSGGHHFIEDALHGMGISVMANELRKTAFQSLDSLDDCTLLISAIACMHRLTRDSFSKSRVLFEHLIEKNPRHALPYAYLSMWHAMSVVQGWSDSPVKDGDIAYNLSSKALDLDPFLGLAHTLHGLVHTNLRKDLALGESSYTTALEYNPNDSLAWLLRGTLYAFQGNGSEGVADTARAMSISPFDPHRYLYYSLSGTAAMIDGRYEEAISLEQESLQLNSKHISTLRILIISLWKIGKYEESKKTVNYLLRVQPEFRVAPWLRVTPFIEPLAADFASVLVKAGIPK